MFFEVLRNFLKRVPFQSSRNELRGRSLKIYIFWTDQRWMRASIEQERQTTQRLMWEESKCYVFGRFSFKALMWLLGNVSSKSSPRWIENLRRISAFTGLYRYILSLESASCVMKWYTYPFYLASCNDTLDVIRIEQMIAHQLIYEVDAGHE